MKEVFNFLKPHGDLILLLMIPGIPGFLLIWLMIDFEIAFWLLIFFITSSFFTFLFGFGDPWGGTILNKLRILIGNFFFIIALCTIFIGGALILGGLFYWLPGSDSDYALPEY